MLAGGKRNGWTGSNRYCAVASRATPMHLEAQTAPPKYLMVRGERRVIRKKTATLSSLSVARCIASTMMVLTAMVIPTRIDRSITSTISAANIVTVRLFWSVVILCR